MLPDKRSFLLALIVAIGLTLLFWFPLWSGGGLIGGDVYTYYMPQKMVYAESLAEGTLPLWHPLTGHGYPMLAESQTGVLYPFHLLFYSTFDVNTAYSITHLLHYLFAFLFLFMFSRKIGLSTIGALFASIIYTFGWFPPRSCLEWAIIGGAWLPLAMWCVESFLQTRWWRYLIGLAVVIDLQLLAGHFHIAFMTLLLIAAYLPLRLWYISRDPSTNATSLPPIKQQTLWKPLGAIGVAIGLGFLLASVQLLPTWELKQQSKRADVQSGMQTNYNPAYGHIPPVYLTQMTTSLFWYTPPTDINSALGAMQSYRVNAPTNKIESHLYFGMIPFWLVSLFFAGAFYSRRRISNWQKMWLLIALLSIVYATGWLMPVARYLPGFRFFQGAGRYGLITTVAIAILTGGLIDHWYQQFSNSPSRKSILIGLMFITVVDLWFVSGWVTNTSVVSTPYINYQKESAVHQILTQYKADQGVPRMWAPGQNLPNLIGFASTPTYLGLSPQAYFNPELIMPISPVPAEVTGKNKPPPLRQVTPEQIAWLQKAGVTHLLSMTEIDITEKPLQLKWKGADQLLHRAWGRRIQEPLYLYELSGSRGRVSFASPQPEQRLKFQQENVNRITIHVTSKNAGQLILTDLAYPGWDVFVDDQPETALVIDGMYRGVDLPAGTHTVRWQFRPRSVLWGAIISLGTLLLLVIIALFRFRYPHKWNV